MLIRFDVTNANKVAVTNVNKVDVTNVNKVDVLHVNQDEVVTNVFCPALNMSPAISSKTIDSILGTKAPIGPYFEKCLIKSASFEISSNIIGDLSRGVEARTLHPGWQSTFIEGMKRFNDVCCFKFKRHRVCGGKMCKLSKKTFYANGCWSFEECPLTFKLTMYNNVIVHVSLMEIVNTHSLVDNHGILDGMIEII